MEGSHIPDSMQHRSSSESLCIYNHRLSWTSNLQTSAAEHAPQTNTSTREPAGAHDLIIGKQPSSDKHPELVLSFEGAVWRETTSRVCKHFVFEHVGSHYVTSYVVCANRRVTARASGFELLYSHSVTSSASDILKISVKSLMSSAKKRLVWQICIVALLSHERC